MELQFHNPTSAKNNHTIFKSRNRGSNKSKFVGVRQRPSGKWVAEIKNTTQKIRMWLGTFDTAEEAAQAYDEASCLLRGSNTRTNFLNNFPCNPALSLKIRNLLNQKISQNKATPSNLVSSTATKPINQEASAKAVSPCIGSQNSTSGSFSSYQMEGSPVFNSNPVNSEDGYMPNFSHLMAGYEMSNPHFSLYDQISNYPMGFDKIALQQDGFYVPKRDGEVVKEVPFPDFERMKVERQISASLYAMSGISEYWDNINDSSDAFWDIPTLCQMFCLS